eukprot:scaffold2232_cov170-Amphora_coffeaeformis.AAC.2
MDYQGDAGGGGFAAGSQPGSGGRNSTRRSPDEQTVLPVTIAMMLTSQTVDERPQLQDGRFLHRVRFVAAVRNFEDMSTNILYEVEDGTGMIEVQQWLDDQKENAKTAEMRELTKKEHVYLKITGQLKDYNGKKKVVADGIRPLTTGNELAHHMLEVVYVEQKQKEKQQQPAFTAGFGQPAAVGRPLQPTAHGQVRILKQSDGKHDDDRPNGDYDYLNYTFAMPNVPDSLSTGFLLYEFFSAPDTSSTFKNVSRLPNGLYVRGAAASLQCWGSKDSL